MSARHAAFRVAFVLHLATFATPLWAGTVLSFDVASHTAAAKGAKQVKGLSTPADTNYVLTVTLSGDALQIDEPDAQTRYDFKNARIDRLDKLKHSYDEVSLYTVIGFNVVEFANRMALGKALAAGKMKDNPMAPALTENLMSMSDPTNATVVDRSAKGDETIYSWKMLPLMTVSQKTREVPEAVLTQYLRFLRYDVGGHPEILGAIERDHGIPERLTIVRSNMGIETRSLTLHSIDERPDSTFSLDGFTRETPAREPFTTLRRLSASSTADLEAHAAVLRQERDAAVAAGRTLDAMLANFAAMLSTGDKSEATAWVAAHRDQINTSADGQRLMRSLNPQDESSAKQAADTFEDMKRSAGPHSYVLNIFEANTRHSLHQGDKAIDLFLTALAADPTITGGWVDLGKLYYNNFSAEAAWACWDAARILRPAHFLLKQVDDLERKLRTDHPEFF
jgi:hypothetical protein